MNIENNSHDLKNYLIGIIAVLLVMFIPTLNWIDKKYSIDLLKLDSKNTNSSDKSKSPELLAANSSDLSKKISSLLTKNPTNTKTESPSPPDNNPTNTKTENPTPSEIGEESISILNKPPPEDATLPRKICMVTSVALKTRGIYAHVFTNLEGESCDVDAFNSMSIASAGAQIAPENQSFHTNKTGPYFSTATKDLTVSDKGFTYIGSQRFAETLSLRIGWIDILRNPGFLLGSSVIRRAQYFPLEAKQDLNSFWSPGEPAYVLVTPNGETYLMTHYSVKLLPGLNRYNLLSLNKLLILPPEWKFVKADIIKPIWLTQGPEQGYTQIMTYDNLGNIYVKADLKSLIDLKNITK